MMAPKGNLFGIFIWHSRRLLEGGPFLKGHDLLEVENQWHSGRQVLPPLGVTDRQHQGRVANFSGGRDHVGLWRERTNFSRRARPRERQLSRLCRGPKNANKRPNRDRPNPDHGGPEIEFGISGGRRQVARALSGQGGERATAWGLSATVSRGARPPGPRGSEPMGCAPLRAG